MYASRQVICPSSVIFVKKKICNLHLDHLLESIVPSDTPMAVNLVSFWYLEQSLRLLTHWLVQDNSLKLYAMKLTVERLL